MRGVDLLFKLDSIWRPMYNSIDALAEKSDEQISYLNPHMISSLHATSAMGDLDRTLALCGEINKNISLLDEKLQNVLLPDINSINSFNVPYGDLKINGIGTPLNNKISQVNSELNKIITVLEKLNNRVCV